MANTFHTATRVARLATFISLAAVFHCGAAMAQAFPSKPITFLLGFPAGGATDVQVRALTAAASKELKQQILILNQPGVAATLAPATMARQAAPDGYTISLLPSSLYRLPHLQKVNFDPLNDFTYIANIAGATIGVVSHPDNPWKNMRELINHAKANPGKVTYGTVGRGSTSHIAMERLSKLAGIKLNFIPFKGAAELYTSVQGGHVNLAIEAGYGVAVDGGKTKLLAIFNGTRTQGRPDTPTIKELGYDVVINGSFGVGGPKGMDPKTVAILRDAFIKATADAEFEKTLSSNDYIKITSDDKAYDAWARKTYVDELRMIKDLGITLEP